MMLSRAGWWKDTCYAHHDVERAETVSSNNYCRVYREKYLRANWWTPPLAEDKDLLKCCKIAYRCKYCIAFENQTLTAGSTGSTNANIGDKKKLLCTLFGLLFQYEKLKTHFSDIGTILSGKSWLWSLFTQGIWSKAAEDNEYLRFKELKNL